MTISRFLSLGLAFAALTTGVARAGDVDHRHRSATHDAVAVSATQNGDGRSERKPCAKDCCAREGAPSETARTPSTDYQRH